LISSPAKVPDWADEMSCFAVHAAGLKAGRISFGCPSALEASILVKIEMIGGNSTQYTFNTR